MKLLVQSLNTGVISFFLALAFWEPSFPIDWLIKMFRFLLILPILLFSLHLEERSDPYWSAEEAAATRDSIKNTTARNHPSNSKAFFFSLFFSFIFWFWVLDKLCLDGSTFISPPLRHCF